MLRIPAHHSLTTLRDFLSESGYCAERLADQFGLSYGLYASLSNLQPLLERTRPDSQLALLARLFFVGWPVPEELCRQYVPGHILQLCVDTGVLTLPAGEFLPSVVIVPFENTLLFAADAVKFRGDNPNVVMGPSASTNLLARAAFRTRTGSVLDFGTGSGALAVLAAGFAERVVATDINERAIAFARFNAALNGADNIVFLLGDAFGPIEGKRFSRIVANPPFFLSAAKRFVYSDSPLELDGFTAKLAREAPAYLDEGGVFQMLCEWVQIEGEPWERRVNSWTAAANCDVLVILGPKLSPADYSEKRFEEATVLHPKGSENLMAERLGYLRRHRVEWVLSGVITMRKREGVNWFAGIPGDLNKHQGRSIEERMDSLTFLNRQSDEQWLAARLRFATDAVINQIQALGENGWELRSLEVAKPNAIGSPLLVDLPVLQAIEMFDGSRTLRTIAEKAAELQQIGFEEAKARCIALAKRLVQGSFVIPAGFDADHG